jgi:hypothetical protein
MTRDVDTFVAQNVSNFQANEDFDGAGILEFEEFAGSSINVDYADNIGGMLIYYSGQNGELVAWYDYENGDGFAPVK